MISGSVSAMEKQEFIRRIFEIAQGWNLRTKIDARGHHAICINETSGTWLHDGHFGQMFDLHVLRANIKPREINAMINGIAPGRSSAHKRMRDILKEMQSEPARQDVL
jgi:hypothetical protein